MLGLYVTAEVENERPEDVGDKAELLQHVQPGRLPRPSHRQYQGHLRGSVHAGRRRVPRARTLAEKAKGNGDRGHAQRSVRADDAGVWRSRGR